MGYCVTLKTASDGSTFLDYVLFIPELGFVIFSSCSTARSKSAVVLGTPISFSDSRSVDYDEGDCCEGTCVPPETDDDFVIG